ncbi:TPM domain-containing protein [Rudanella paleaurantiibacter]|uniref:TPM domain-containing protein n=1 Tax=Rudanella paleaurantiibacter TaxID=2614655 RepID=A0A7J5TX32_9BACT|nr:MULTISPECIES: TPM domain-containing protein [Rudanella]KAB7729194.1 TPM domain-containing protein [Rudanella paleaurantiibacter]
MQIPAEQQQQIIAAIKQAELATSGEVRVHIEGPCPTGDPVARAIEVFAHLGMHQTREQNGVLFYLAVDDRKFAVIGDKGIDARVPAGFWDETKELMRRHFAQGQYAEGLAGGIARAGEQLKHYFPRLADDSNELSDDISFS